MSSCTEAQSDVHLWSLNVFGGLQVIQSVLFWTGSLLNIDWHQKHESM